MIEFALSKYEKIDILVNNAGISQIKLFTDLTDEDIDNMLDINLKSVIHITKEVLPNMVRNKSGSIINISSVWGITGASCEAVYSAAKARSNRTYKITRKRARSIQYKSKWNSTRVYNDRYE